jgi:signal transduction histidine kinase
MKFDVRAYAYRDEVLLLGKADAGKLEFKPAPLDLVEFCKNLVEPLQLNADSQHKIIFRAQGNCENACMDEYLLRHILTNLLSNAIKYSPTGGDVNFQLDCDQQTVTFRIADSGIGIPKQDLERLFESFYRATNVGNIQGTGLGLSIIKNCIDLHGGKIDVQSTVGEGTTFTVTLPYRTDSLHKH